MDFGTIRMKLEKNEYQDASGLLKDAQQVFINCFTFNLPDDIVTQMGRDVEAEFNKLCAAKNLKGIPISNPQHVSGTIPAPSTTYDPDLDLEQHHTEDDPLTSTTFDPAAIVPGSFDDHDPLTTYQQPDAQQFGYDIPFDQSLGYDHSVGFDQPDFTAGISLDMDPLANHKRTLDDYGGDGQGDPSQDYDMDHSDEFIFGKKRRIL
ncbi:hypothetical protein BDA99DRAFT_8590 [Phascolomyces articulosus]|uniref:Bromo domain-containing protein n=1 Tax=Phascolomyces articulosus TaxID=60185 RepID=A0AAD5KRC8_9FUNG|nr:hypothetical protein BDA99DRAFT_8590 [Phascolomyces articulosus]